jgi:hypothetical protein
MSELGIAGEAVHSCGDSCCASVAAPAMDDPFAGLMEKNMSKSNDSSKLGRATQVRELRDDELAEVSGGACCNGQHLSEIVVTKPTDVASFSFGISHMST